MPGLPAIGGIVRAGKIFERGLDTERALNLGADAERAFERTASDVEKLNEILRSAGGKVSVRLDKEIDVYRVCGGRSKTIGRSWTTVNPRGYSWIKFKLGAALPDANSMTHIAKARIKAGTVVDIMPSTPANSRLLGWLPGGLPEVRVDPSRITLAGDPMRWMW